METALGWAGPGQGARHASHSGTLCLQQWLQCYSSRTSFPCFKSGVCVCFGKTTSRGCTFHWKEMVDLVGVCTLLEWWQRYPSRKNTWSVINSKRHSECQNVTYNSYSCFVNESQVGVLFDLHGRQKFFLMKDCKILLFYYSFSNEVSVLWSEVNEFYNFYCYYYCFYFHVNWILRFVI